MYVELNVNLCVKIDAPRSENYRTMRGNNILSRISKLILIYFASKKHEIYLVQFIM